MGKEKVLSPNKKLSASNRTSGPIMARARPRAFKLPLRGLRKALTWAFGRSRMKRRRKKFFNQTIRLINRGRDFLVAHMWDTAQHAVWNNNKGVNGTLSLSELLEQGEFAQLWQYKFLLAKRGEVYFSSYQESARGKIFHTVFVWRTRAEREINIYFSLWKLERQTASHGKQTNLLKLSWKKIPSITL